VSFIINGFFAYNLAKYAGKKSADFR
jgi:hypothetical protein